MEQATEHYPDIFREEVFTEDNVSGITAAAAAVAAGGAESSSRYLCDLFRYLILADPWHYLRMHLSVCVHR